uniref:Uncharacterized protein n=1 Tax=Chenopodium quinoa TaxID=63459 RepID=A0A803MUW7_CHEQI
MANEEPACSGFVGYQGERGDLEEYGGKLQQSSMADDDYNDIDMGSVAAVCEVAVCARISSRILASESRDRNILQHDLRVSNYYVSKLVGHKSKVCGLKWSHDDREIASGGDDNQLLVWNQHSQQPVLKLSEHTAVVKARACIS